ncbi:MAG: DNA-binding protein [Desulfovibrio sp.]|nr:DNA-binding protein [Desulfovibrio sp.]MCA1987361.1 DNA-binding protein [Desulfovibrio sp.]
MSHLLKRLPKGADLLDALTAVCKEHHVTRGSVQVIGALEKAMLGFYLQHEQRYISHAVDEHVEILMGAGNVSLKDGEPFIHLHLTLSRHDGSCLGGHAMAGCPIFAAEACILRLEGKPLVRGLDEATGLYLWTNS